MFKIWRLAVAEKIVEKAREGFTTRLEGSTLGNTRKIEKVKQLHQRNEEGTMVALSVTSGINPKKKKKGHTPAD